MRPKLVDYDAMRKAFDEKFKETRRLIEEGETHLDNLAEGFHEADKVIWSMPTIDAVPVVRCSECRRRYDHNECPMCFLIDGVYHEYTSGIGFCDRGERKDGDTNG